VRACAFGTVLRHGLHTHWPAQYVGACLHSCPVTFEANTFSLESAARVERVQVRARGDNWVLHRAQWAHVGAGQAGPG